MKSRPTENPPSRFRDVTVTYDLPAEATVAVQVLARQAEATPFMVFLAAFQVLLHRWSGADDVVVFGGGIIPDDDIPRLKEAGVRALFRPGTSMADIVDFLRGLRH